MTEGVRSRAFASVKMPRSRLERAIVIIGAVWRKKTVIGVATEAAPFKPQTICHEARLSGRPPGARIFRGMSAALA